MSSNGPAWRQLVHDILVDVDAEWGVGTSLLAWTKPDGSLVTALDLRLDAAIRTRVAYHYVGARVLSEETGVFEPIKNARGSTLVIIDPVDGTESLIRGRDTWWISVGIVEDGIEVAGLIYQPSTRRIHDSAQPTYIRSRELLVGLSPDRLHADETQAIRDRLTSAGAKLVSAPHAVEKVAAVLEGRAAACAFLPSNKSPHWHSWDLAAGIAIGKSNGLVLRTLDGRPVRVDPTRIERDEAWICASDESAWEAVHRAVC